jgi:chromosome segregation ATPase
MPEEERLIAELTVCKQESLAAQSALTNPQHLVFFDEHRKLAEAAEIARGKLEGVRVRLRSLRIAKLRKKDSHDVHKLQNAISGLAEEIDTITYASEAGKERTPGPEASAAYQERYQHLEKIREKLSELTLVMDSVDGKPRAPSRGSANSDIGEALQKLQSAESNLGDVETHLNNVEGAHSGDQDEIASARSSASDLETDLKGAKAALEKVSP